MKALVTGGAGFIGSHVVDLLVEEGFETIVVDNLATGREENVNKAAKLYKLDICDPELEKVFKKEKPEFVLHQAAQANVRKSIEDPVFDATVNILGSINLLECCKKNEVKKVVYASSGGACYGEPRYLPCDEKHSIKPICPYGISKAMVEHYLFQYKNNFGLDYTILRYSNVYGPRQDPLGEAGVVAIFLDKFMKNEQAVINGEGTQTRDFVYVSDVVRANFLGLTTESNKKIFNIGTGIETSVNELSEELVGITKPKKKPIHGPVLQGEVYRIYLDVSLAKKELDWKPQIGLSEGLKKTAEWFENVQGSST